MSRISHTGRALRAALPWLVPAASIVLAVAACGTAASVPDAKGLGASSSGGATSSTPPGDTDILDASLDVGGAWPTQPLDASSLPDAGAVTFGEDGAAPTPPAAHCSGLATPPTGDTTITLTSGGLVRDAIVHIPTNYDPSNGTMLVLSFHGFSSNSWEQELLTQMDPAADARNFIVVYPDGVASSWNAGSCCGVAWNNSVNDLQFVTDLLAYLEAKYCIDASRIYATGMSNGGFLAHRLGCSMANVFAAIAPVAGVMGIPDDDCKPSRPMPVLDFHGKLDPVVPYNGGSAASGLGGSLVTFDSVPQTIDLWLALDVCLTPGVTVYNVGDALCVDYAQCARGGEVVQCIISDGGHTWPGGVPIPLGVTSSSISATDTMIDFFLAHPLQ